MPAQYSQQSTTKSSSTDVAAWALVGLIVVLICAVAGWAYARQSVPSNDDLRTEAILAQREAEVRGMRDGYSQGISTGRKEARLSGELEQRQSALNSYQDGRAQGITAGRNQAAAKANGFEADGLGLNAGAYPSAGYEDVLASDLFDDAPGYSSSSYDTYGSGTAGATSYGDDY